MTSAAPNPGAATADPETAFWAFLFQLSWLLWALSLGLSLILRLTAPPPLRQKAYFRLGLLTAAVVLVSWAHAGTVATPENELRAALSHVPIILTAVVLIWLGRHDGQEDLPR
ncbi:MAG: hypothetical protein U1A78_30410 [Polyangia bacterium]